MEAFLAYLATPVYALFIALEIYLSKIHSKSLYSGKDSVNSILLGVGGAIMDLLMKHRKNGRRFPLIQGNFDNFLVSSANNLNQNFIAFLMFSN